MIALCKCGAYRRGVCAWAELWLDVAEPPSHVCVKMGTAHGYALVSPYVFMAAYARACTATSSRLRSTDDDLYMMA